MKTAPKNVTTAADYEPIDYSRFQAKRNILLNVTARRVGEPLLDLMGNPVPEAEWERAYQIGFYPTPTKRYWFRSEIASYLRRIGSVTLILDGTEYRIPMLGKSKKTIGRFAEMALAIPDFLNDVELDDSGEIKIGFGLNPYQAFVVVAIAQHSSIWSFFRNGSNWYDAAWDEIISRADSLSRVAWAARINQSLEPTEPTETIN